MNARKLIHRIVEHLGKKIYTFQKNDKIFTEIIFWREIIHSTTGWTVNVVFGKDSSPQDPFPSPHPHLH